MAEAGRLGIFTPMCNKAQISDEASVPAMSVDFGSLRCPITIIESYRAFDPDHPRFDFANTDAAGVDQELIPGTSHFLTAQSGLVLRVRPSW